MKCYVVTMEDVNTETYYSGAIDEPTALAVVAEIANAMRAMTFAESTICDAMEQYIQQSGYDL